MAIRTLRLPERLDRLSEAHRTDLGISMNAFICLCVHAYCAQNPEIDIDLSRSAHPGTLPKASPMGMSKQHKGKR